MASGKVGNTQNGSFRRTFFLLPLCSFLIFFACSFLDKSLSENSIPYLSEVNVSEVRKSLDNVVRNLAIILGILVCSTFVVLQMFSANFLPHATSLFFRNEVVLNVFRYFTCSLVFCIYLCTSISAAEANEGILIIPKVSFVVANLMQIVGFSLMYPYFYYLNQFLSPGRLISQVAKDAIQVLDAFAKQTKIREKNLRSLVSETQQKLVNSINLLSDVGLSTLRDKNVENFNIALLSIYDVYSRYLEYKQKKKLPEQWHQMEASVLQDADFSALDIQRIQLLAKQKTWVENKILRCLKLIYETALEMDYSDGVRIATGSLRRLATLAIRKGDFNTCVLCQKYLNTFIKKLIHMSKLGLLSDAFSDYKILGLEILDFLAHLKKEENMATGSTRYGPSNNMKSLRNIKANSMHGGRRASQAPMANVKEEVMSYKECDTLTPLQNKIRFCEKFLVRIVWCMRYYLTHVLDKKLPVISEIVAHDIGAILSKSIIVSESTHEVMLSLFLSLSQTTSGISKQDLHGILRSQVKLGIEYLAKGKPSFSAEIQIELEKEPVETLQRLYRDISAVKSPFFWEVSNRWKNMNYLEPQHKKLMNIFFGSFTRFIGTESIKKDEEIKSSDSKVKVLASENRTKSVIRTPTMGVKRSMKRKKQGRSILSAGKALKLKSFIKRMCKNIKLWQVLFVFGLFVLFLHLVLDALYVHMSEPGDYPDKCSSAETARLFLGQIDLTSVLLFTLMCVTSMIIVQLTASRFKFPPYLLFFMMDTTLFWILVLVSITFFLSVITTMFVEEERLSCLSLYLVFVLCTLNVLLTFAYFQRFIDFLKPTNVLVRERKFVLSCIVNNPKMYLKEKQKSAKVLPQEIASFDGSHYDKDEWQNGDIDEAQCAAHSGIKRICRFTVAAIQQSDDQNLIAGLEALSWIVDQYISIKDDLPQMWFVIQHSLRISSDFVGMQNDALARITESKSWFESVIFRQYLELFRECLQHSRFDGCNRLMLLSETIISNLIVAGDLSAVDTLSIYLNTYIRIIINSSNIQVGLGMVHHYKKIILVCIQKHFASNDWAKLIEKLCSFLKYYLNIALERNLGLIAESIAESFCTLCIEAVKIKFKWHEQLLDTFLTIDDFAIKSSDSSALVGIRTCQVRLAVKYMGLNKTEQSKKVALDMQDEPLSILKLVARAILSTDTPEFWEVSNRGLKSSHLEQEEFNHLLNFFELNFPYKIEEIGLSDKHFKALERRETNFEDRKTVVGLKRDVNFLQVQEMVAVHKNHNRRSNMTKVSFNSLRISIFKFLGGLAFPVLVPIVSTIALIWCMVSILDAEPVSLSLRWNYSNSSTNPVAKQNTGAILSLEYGIRLFSILGMCSLIALSKSPSRSADHIIAEVTRVKLFRFVMYIFLASMISSLWTTFDALVLFKSNLFVLSLIFISGCIVFVYPYFVHLFTILHPESIIHSISSNKLHKLRTLFSKTLPENASDTSSSQNAVTKSLENLAICVPESIDTIVDLCCSSIRTKNKAGAFSAIDYMGELISMYEEAKIKMPGNWHALFMEIKALSASSDFVNLSPNFKNAVKEQRLWVEWKLLRQYQLIFEKSMVNMSEVGFNISMATRKLAQTSLLFQDLNVYHLCVKFINSFLRTAISCKHLSSIFNIIYQYRLLAEFVIWSHIENRLKINPETIDKLLLNIGTYLRYYASLCLMNGLPFIATVVSHDLSTICFLAYSANFPCHDDLLDLLLTIDENDVEGASRSGIRRYQIQLATKYMLSDDDECAQTIWKHTVNDPVRDLKLLKREMLSQQAKEYWEIHERGYNFEYISEQEQSMLPKFYSWYSWKEESRDSQLVASPEQRQNQKLLANKPLNLPMKKVLLKETLQGLSSLSNTFDDKFRQIGSLEVQSQIESCFMDEIEEDNQKQATISPIPETFNFRKHYSFDKVSLLSSLSVFAVTLVMIILCIGFEPLQFHRTDNSTAVPSFSKRFTTLMNLEYNDTQGSLRMLGKVSVILFSSILIPSLIILQINSRELLARITAQYFNNGRVLFVLILSVFTCLFLIWISYITDPSTGSDKPGMQSVAILSNGFGLFFVSITLLSFLPYFSLLFKFLDTKSLIFSLLKSALNITRECVDEHNSIQSQSTDTVSLRGITDNGIFRKQKRVHTILREVCWFGVFSIQNKEKASGNLVIYCLSSFIKSYIQNKEFLKEEWFDCIDTGSSLCQTPEFAVLSEIRKEQIKEQKTWVEFTVLRQFLMLFVEDLVERTGIGTIVTIETRKLAVFALEQRKHESLNLIIKTFNTFIRSCFNAKNVRAVFNVCHQYRQFLEAVLLTANDMSNDTQELETLLLNGATHLAYYGVVAHSSKLAFATEIAANDVYSLCELCYVAADNLINLTDDLYEILFSMMKSVANSFEARNEVSEHNQQLLEAELEPIGRVLMKLMTLFFVSNDLYRVDRISSVLVQSFKYNNGEMLRKIKSKLQAITSREYHEINDRGMNFDYISDLRRQSLDFLHNMNWCINLDENISQRFSDSMDLRNESTEETCSDMRAIHRRLSTRKSHRRDSFSAISRNMQRYLEGELDLSSTTDELNVTDRQDSSMSKWRSTIFYLPFVALLVSLLLAGLNCGIGSYLDTSYGFSECAKSFRYQDHSKMMQLPTQRALAAMMVTFLGFLTTVSSIVLQIASARFNSGVIYLLMRSTRIRGYLLLVFSTTFFLIIQSCSLLINNSIAVVLSIALSFCCLFGFIPYIAYLFQSLDSERLLKEIFKDGIDAAFSKVGSGSNIDRQKRFIEAMESICSFSSNALLCKDKSSAHIGIDLLFKFCIKYKVKKRKLKKTKFLDISSLISQKDPDFASLSRASMKSMGKSKQWVEWKILRLAEVLFADSCEYFLDGAQQVACGLRYVSETSLMLNDYECINLIIKFFNTFIRYTINRGEVVAAEYVFLEYRKTIEGLSEDKSQRAQDLVEKMTGYLSEYSLLAANQRQINITEIILSEVALLALSHFDSDRHELTNYTMEKCFNIFGKMRDGEIEIPPSTSVFMTRLMIKLGTELISREGETFARTIFNVMKDESMDLLQQAWDDFNMVDADDHWEVSNTSSSRSYIREEQMPHLTTFYKWFGAEVMFNLRSPKSPKESKLDKNRKHI